MTLPTSAPFDPIRVREEAVLRPAALVHEGWARAFPWLVQGTTTRGTDDGFDLGLFSTGSSEERVRANWSELAEATGFRTVVHAQQVHGSDVHVTAGEDLSPMSSHHDPATVASRRRDGSISPGSGLPLLLDPADGHLTGRPGVLLAVTIADCVPVFLVDPRGRSVAAVHAGWRGVAAGILERAVETMEVALGTSSADVHIHLGPAICGGCYEVGPEVFEALGQAVPSSNQPIDVRGVLAARAHALGVGRERISVSEHCTRCTGSSLYSHRAGHAQRQVGFIGIREPARS